LNRRSLRVTSAITLALIALWGFLSPYVTVYRLRDAAERGDSDRLSTMIDYPALRESLKASLRASMAARAVDDDDPLATLGILWVGAMIDPLVDSMISPEGMAAMVQGSIPKPGQSRAAASMTLPSGDGSAVPADGREEMLLETSMGYESFSRFAVTFTDKRTRVEHMKLIFHRRGLSWKLAGMTLPRL
jgi:Protein of unknown function (DUF2939)